MSDFSIRGPETGDVVTAPVRQYADGNVLSTLARGVDFFREQRDVSTQRRRQREADRREAERHAAWQRQQREQDVQREIGSAVVRYLSGAEQSVEQTGRIIMPEPAAPGPAGSNPLLEAFNYGASGAQRFARQFLDGAREDPAVDNEVLDQIVRSVEAEAPNIQSRQIAAEQGRMPGIAATAGVDNLVRQLVNRFPGYEFLIGAALKDVGLDNQMFNDLRDAYEQQNAIRDARSSTLSEALQVGIQLAGPEGAAMADEQLIANGLAELRRRAQADANKQALELIKMEREISTADRALRDDNREETERVLQQEISGQAISLLSPRVNSYMALLAQAPEPGSDPIYEQRLEEARVLLVRDLNNIVENTRANLLTTTDPTTANNVANTLKSYLEGTFVTPLTERDNSVGRLAQQMQNRLGLSVRHSFPVIAMMRELGMDPDSIGSVVNAIGGDEELVQRLSREIQGLDNFNLGTPQARVQLQEIVGILTGDERLRARNHTPQSARQIFNVVNRTTQQLAARAATGDENAVPAFLNGIGELTIAAGQLNSQSGVNPIVNAGITLLADSNGGRVIDAFTNAMRVDPEKARITALGWRGGVANVLNSMRPLLSSAEGRQSTLFFRPAWSRTEGRYVAEFDEQAWNEYYRNLPTGRGGYGDNPNLMTTRPSAPPTQFTGQLALANNLLNALINTRQWDEDTPQGTPLELRQWYARGEPTAAMRREMEATNARRRVNPRSNRIQAVDAFINELENNPLTLSVPQTESQIRDQTGGEGTGNFSPSSDFSSFTRIVGHGESGGRTDAVNPESNITARGLYGFTRGTFVTNYARAYGVSRAEAEARWEGGAWRNRDVQNRLLQHVVREYDTTFANNGLPVNNGTRYLAHFLGPQTAVAMMKARPGESIESVITRAVSSPRLRQAILNSRTNRAVFNRAGGTAGGLVREFYRRASN